MYQEPPPIQRSYKNKPIYVERQTNRPSIFEDVSKFSTSYNSVNSEYSYKSVSSSSSKSSRIFEKEETSSYPRFGGSGSRVKRATERIVEPEYIRDAEGRSQRVVVFDCGRATAKCLTITCDIPR